MEADSEEVSGNLYQYFADNPYDFHRMQPREFEKLISSIFAAHGWRTELGPGFADQGIDLRVWQTDPLGDILTLVQIKRYATHRAIHLEAVAALEAHVNREGANRGLFVTSSRYLPGVKAFADREKYRLQLRDQADLQQWCQEASQATRTAKNRALAMESFRPLVEEIRQTRPHPKLVVADNYGPSFCVILRETKTSALLVHIPSERVSGDLQSGQMMPLLNGEIQELPNGTIVFRATRTERNGDVSYWGQRMLYYV